MGAGAPHKAGATVEVARVSERPARARDVLWIAIYKLWEEGGRVPVFVMEVSSRKTWLEDIGNKKALCARLGVADYFLFDPEEDGRWRATVSRRRGIASRRRRIASVPMRSRRGFASSRRYILTGVDTGRPARYKSGHHKNNGGHFWWCSTSKEAGRRRLTPVSARSLVGNSTAAPLGATKPGGLRQWSGLLAWQAAAAPQGNLSPGPLPRRHSQGAPISYQVSSSPQTCTSQLPSSNGPTEQVLPTSRQGVSL